MNKYKYEAMLTVEAAFIFPIVILIVFTVLGLAFLLQAKTELECENDVYVINEFEKRERNLQPEVTISHEMTLGKSQLGYFSYFLNGYCNDNAHLRLPERSVMRKGILIQREMLETIGPD